MIGTLSAVSVILGIVPLWTRRVGVVAPLLTMQSLTVAAVVLLNGHPWIACAHAATCAIVGPWFVYRYGARDDQTDHPWLVGLGAGLVLLAVPFGSVWAALSLLLLGLVRIAERGNAASVVAGIVSIQGSAILLAPIAVGPILLCYAVLACEPSLRRLWRAS